MYSPINIAKPALNGKHNHNFTDTDKFDTSAHDTVAQERTFPSLSKGTLKTTYLQNHNTTGQYKLLTSMTKDYNEKTMFFFFKKPVKSSNQDEESLKPNTQDYNSTPVERTEFQIEESKERSIARTRREISDLAQMNHFNLFVTLTFDPKKHDAYDQQECIRKANRFMANQKRLHGDFNHLMVAELMKDGKVHLHALIGGYTGKLRDVPPRQKGDLLLNCYKLDAWEKTYGFGDAEQIADKERIANYIVKYISKDIESDFHEKGKKRYFASKNLVRPKKAYNQDIDTLVQSGLFDVSAAQEYENEFVKVTTLPKKRKE